MNVLEILVGVEAKEGTALELALLPKPKGLAVGAAGWAGPEAVAADADEGALELSPPRDCHSLSILERSSL